MLTILEMVCQCPPGGQRDLVEQKSWCPHDTFPQDISLSSCFLPLLCHPNLESQYNQRIQKGPGWILKVTPVTHTYD